MNLYTLVFCCALLMGSCQPEINKQNKTTPEETTENKSNRTKPKESPKKFSWDILNIEGEDLPFCIIKFNYGDQSFELDTIDGFVSACDLNQLEGPCLLRLPENVLGLYQGFYAGIITEGYLLLNNKTLEHWQRFGDEMDETENNFELTETL